ncbi:MAG: sugar transferase [Nitrospiraceae bacterium]|nr:sugar transferase [Nitrospiraceae bacterium]
MALLAGDVAVTVFSAHFFFFIGFFSSTAAMPGGFDGAVFFFALCCLLSFYLFDLYDPKWRLGSLRFISWYLLAVGAALAASLIVFHVLPGWRAGRGAFLACAPAAAVCVYLWRMAFSYLAGRAGKKGLVIIGTGRTGKAIYEALAEKGGGFDLKGFIDDDPVKSGRRIGGLEVIGGSVSLADLAHKGQIGAAVIAVGQVDNPALLKAVITSRMNGAEIYDMPSLYEELTGKVPVSHLTDNWIAHTTFQGVRKSLYAERIKKALDFVLALCGLIVTCPVSLAAAAAIKIEGKGPVFYRQERVGLQGNVYRLVKFRSMKADAEACGAMWASENDPRVTRVGRIIRKTRADEIPQMWNVLKGEMSFIGPRPERPEFVGLLEDNIPFYSLRHSIKPGITGWAQVNYGYGASEKDALEKLQYDFFYMKNMSPFLDLHILLKTLRVVLLGKGAR